MSEDTNIFQKYKIPDEFVQVDVSGAQGSENIKVRTTSGATELYKGTGGIRSTRAGYTSITLLSYKDKRQAGVFYLPLPESFYVAHDYDWSEKSEEGLTELVSRLAQNGGNIGLEGIMQAGSQTSARFAFNQLRSKLESLGDAKGTGGPLQGIMDAAMRGAGVAYNPNKQMYFNGPTFSTGQWTFKLVPKSKKEAAIMYNTAKCLMIMAAPGADGNGFFSMLGTLGNMAKNIIWHQSGNAGSPQEDAETKKAIEDIQAGKVLNSNFINTQQPVFFSYPNLLNVGFHVTRSDGTTKPIFEWNYLAITSVKMTFGTNMKWHPDGYPVTLDLDLNVTDTVVRTAATMGSIIPTIID